MSLLADEKFADLVDYHRDERELPEDERERLLIDTALAGLQHLADMGDTKALLFLTYEGNRGRHPENRLRRLTLPRTAHLPPRFRSFDPFRPLSRAEPPPRLRPRPRANPFGPRRRRPGHPGARRLDPPLAREPPGPAGRERGRGGRAGERVTKKEA